MVAINNTELTRYPVSRNNHEEFQSTEQFLPVACNPYPLSTSSCRSHETTLFEIGSSTTASPQLPSDVENMLIIDGHDNRLIPVEDTMRAEGEEQRPFSTSRADQNFSIHDHLSSVPQTVTLQDFVLRKYEDSFEFNNGTRPNIEIGINNVPKHESHGVTRVRFGQGRSKRFISEVARRLQNRRSSRTGTQQSRQRQREYIRAAHDSSSDCHSDVNSGLSRKRRGGDDNKGYRQFKNISTEGDIELDGVTKFKQKSPDWKNDNNTLKDRVLMSSGPILFAPIPEASNELVKTTKVKRHRLYNMYDCDQVADELHGRQSYETAAARMNRRDYQDSQLDSSREEEGVFLGSGEGRAVTIREDVMQASDDEDEKDDESLDKFSHRISWLIVLLILQSLSGTILEAFENLIRRHPAVVVFLTMLIGSGGNAGDPVRCNYNSLCTRSGLFLL